MSKSDLTKTDISRLIEQLGTDKVKIFPGKGSEYGSASDWVVFAESEQEAVKVIRWAGESQVSILPEGQGALAGYGNPVCKEAVTLSLAKLNQVTEHSVGDLTVTVQAGTLLSHLQAVLKEKGQMLPLDPGWPEIRTAGGSWLRP